MIVAKLGKNAVIVVVADFVYLLRNRIIIKVGSMVDFAS
jgi:hypothetical protein